MIRDEIKKAILKTVQKMDGGKTVPVFSVEVPEIPEHGDFATNVAFVITRTLAKQIEEKTSTLQSPDIPAIKIRTGDTAWHRVTGSYPTKPLDLAQYLVDHLKKETDLFKKVEVAPPGFINFSLKDEFLLKKLQAVREKPGQWGKSDAGKGKTIVVEYFQLNIGKRPHVGHLRSAVIGDAIARIFECAGYSVKTDTHQGDWGTQFGILLWAFKKLSPSDRAALMKELEENPLEGFHRLNLLYSGANKTAEGYDENPGKEEFAKLERGEAENRNIWRELKGASEENFLRGGVKLLRLRDFEEYKGESEYETDMPAIVNGALKKGVARKKDEAIVVDLSGEGLDEAVLIKSDGASTYLLRDLATIIYRKKKWKFAKSLYVVDVRQSHHFKQLFRVAEKLGFEGWGESQHIEFGFMKLPEGALSTRAGNVISLNALLDEAEKRARAVIQEKNPDLKNKKEIAKQVGLGAIKYFDLSHNRRSGIVFRWEDALSFEGDTGPYLQYARARLNSILQKAKEAGISKKIPDSSELDPLEHRLAAAVLRYPEAIEDALAEYLPNILAHYLYSLARTANEFYHSRPVLQEADAQKRAVRLLIVETVATTLKHGLGLLGIESPDEM